MIFAFKKFRGKHWFLSQANSVEMLCTSGTLFFGKFSHNFGNGFFARRSRQFHRDSQTNGYAGIGLGLSLELVKRVSSCVQWLCSSITRYFCRERFAERRNWFIKWFYVPILRFDKRRLLWTQRAYNLWSPRTETKLGISTFLLFICFKVTARQRSLLGLVVGTTKFDLSTQTERGNKVVVQTIEVKLRDESFIPHP